MIKVILNCGKQYLIASPSEDLLAQLESALFSMAAPKMRAVSAITGTNCDLIVSTKRDGYYAVDKVSMLREQIAALEYFVANHALETKLHTLAGRQGSEL